MGLLSKAVARAVLICVYGVRVALPRPMFNGEYEYMKSNTPSQSGDSHRVRPFGEAYYSERHPQTDIPSSSQAPPPERLFGYHQTHTFVDPGDASYRVSASHSPFAYDDTEEGTLESVVFGNRWRASSHQPISDQTPLLQGDIISQTAHSRDNPDQHEATHHAEAEVEVEAEESSGISAIMRARLEKSRHLSPFEVSLINRKSGRRGKREVNSNWTDYFDVEKGEILEVLHLYTGLLKDSIARRCRQLFSDAMKEDLLSKDERRIIPVRDALFSPSAPTRQRQLWMEGMSMEDSKIVVHKIAKVCGKDEEVVRNHFLRIQISKEAAHEILHASRQECEFYAMKFGLDNSNTKMVSKGTYRVPSRVIEPWPWMYDLSEKNKETVVKRMMIVGGLDERSCYELLRQPQVSCMLGVRLLKAGTEEVAAMIQKMIRRERV
ncbi:hypothetical protein CBS101457_000077 [Exobasidium rhododendri]|nr:hypothetical protein CBS101457_000077 [Exobasidium rhododendri]